MDAVTINFAPATGTDGEWNEAYARLADYYRSYRLHNRLRRTHVILTTLQRAAEAHGRDPSRKPTEHSIEQARLMMQEWLGHIYHDLHLTEAQIAASGKVGFFLAGGPDKWPTSFLDEAKTSPEMVEAMRQAVRTSGPGLHVSKMTPREIDLGLTNVAEDTLTRLNEQPWARYALLAVFVAAVFGYLYKLLS